MSVWIGPMFKVTEFPRHPAVMLNDEGEASVATIFSVLDLSGSFGDVAVAKALHRLHDAPEDLPHRDRLLALFGHAAEFGFGICYAWNGQIFDADCGWGTGFYETQEPVELAGGSMNFGSAAALFEKLGYGASIGECAMSVQVPAGDLDPLIDRLRAMLYDARAIDGDTALRAHRVLIEALRCQQLDRDLIACG